MNSAPKSEDEPLVCNDESAPGGKKWSTGKRRIRKVIEDDNDYEQKQMDALLDPEIGGSD